MELRRLDWDQVKPIWDTKLWPGRDSEPVTSMKYLGGYEMPYKDQTPTFMGIVTGDHIVAVNSYVRTHDDEYRSRGLWVDPNFRGQGHAKSILEYMADWIQQEGGTTVWTMPREEALPAYQAAGFIRTSGWFNADWGRNCYALKSLRTIEDIEAEAIIMLAGRRTFYVNKMSKRGKMTTEEARLLMRQLADDEKRRWG